MPPERPVKLTRSHRAIYLCGGSLTSGPRDDCPCSEAEDEECE